MLAGIVQRSIALILLLSVLRVEAAPEKNCTHSGRNIVHLW